MCCMLSLTSAYAVMKVYLVFKISIVSVVSDEIIFYFVLEISVVSVVTGEVIFSVLYVVSKVSVVSDKSISGI